MVQLRLIVVELSKPSRLTLTNPCSKGLKARAEMDQGPACNRRLKGRGASGNHFAPGSAGLFNLRAHPSGTRHRMTVAASGTHPFPPGPNHVNLEVDPTPPGFR